MVCVLAERLEILPPAMAPPPMLRPLVSTMAFPPTVNELALELKARLLMIEPVRLLLGVSRVLPAKVSKSFVPGAVPRLQLPVVLQLSLAPPPVQVVLAAVRDKVVSRLAAQAAIIVRRREFEGLVGRILILMGCWFFCFLGFLIFVI